MYLKLLGFVIALFSVCPAELSFARSVDMLKPCSSCHTMHNSQSGNSNINGIGPQSALLGSTCIGCHTGVNEIDPGRIHTPYVYSTGQPIYGNTGTEPGHNTLAGGSFYWVAQGNDLKGHNVNIPGVNLPSLTCAGLNGCHGKLNVLNEITAMSQTHHGVAPKSSVAPGFRFLDGVEGLEDPAYELSVSSTVHNQYKGVARNSDIDAAAKSISSLCAKCHGNFHSITGTGYGTSDPWIRHPVDIDMGGLGGEYVNYGSSGTYNVATPLGSSDISSVKDKVSLLTPAGDAIVVCVSCHRAHGSPYDYNLRWNYLAWPSSGYNGCGDCHTAKN